MAREMTSGNAPERNASNGEMPSLVIYGAGQHGHVVAEAGEAAGMEVLGFVDDGLHEGQHARRPLLQPDEPQLEGAGWIVAVGDNLTRQRLVSDLIFAGCSILNVIHPTAWVSPSATLGQGVFIGPGAIVHTGATLGDGAIVNSGAIVEHDCIVGAYVHLGPGAALGGQASVSAHSLMGLNASVLPRVKVGERCTVGAGAVVTRDVAEGQTVVGVPARGDDRS